MGFSLQCTAPHFATAGFERRRNRLFSQKYNLHACYVSVVAAAAAEASAHVHHLHASQDEVPHEKEGREQNLTFLLENINRSSVVLLIFGGSPERFSLLSLDNPT
jgi:hypothetical protein